MVYSKRLVGPTVPAAGVQIVGTVPAGKVWLLRSVNVVNTGGAALFAGLFIGGSAAANYVWYEGAAGIASGGSVHRDVRIVAFAGEVIRAQGSGSGTYTLTGYELDAA